MANIKNCFYAVVRHLAARPDHFARVVLGSSCEAWINAEAFVALSWASTPVLGVGEYMHPEHRKRDLVVCGPKGVTHIVEVKVLHPWPDSKLRNEKLRILRRQLERPAHVDNPGIRYIGLVVALWTSRYQSEKPNKFFRRASELLKEEFPPTEYTTQHSYRFKPIVKGHRITLNGDGYEVHARAAYVTRFREDRRG